MKKQYERECDEYWNSLSDEERLKAFYSVIRRVVKGEIEDKGSYRYLLYDVFEFGKAMKQAYKKVYNTHGLYDFIPVELTGKCKKVSGGPWWSDNFSSELYYIQVQRRVFGIPLGKYWVEKDSISLRDPVTEIVYNCDLLNDDCELKMENSKDDL